MSGVLDVTYARARTTKPHLAFRYQERALVAVDAAKKYGRVPSSVSLVDFGASEGRTLLEMRRLLGGVGTYLGIEYDTGLIASAPALPAGVSLVQGDITDLRGTIPDASADIVTALAVLEHLADPVLALREAERILKPGGLFIATAPNPFWDRVADRLGMSAFGGEHHEIALDDAVFRGLLGRTALEHVAFFPFMWAPIGFLPYLRISVSAAAAWRIDQLIQTIAPLRWSFVNQCFVARKKR